MNAGDLIEALERFFLDIIGTVLPGLAMLVGYCYVTGEPLVDVSQVLFNRSTDYEWVFLIALAYVLGHAITSLGFKITKKLEYAHQGDPAVKGEISGGKGNRFLSFVSSEKELAKKLSEDPIYKAFLESLLKRIPALPTESKQLTNPRTWRNMALSIAPEQSQLVYRFMFIALLNLGMSTVCICIFVLWIALICLNAFQVPVSVIDLNPLLALLIVLPYFFLERFYNFSRRAFQVPFSMALAKLAEQIEDSSRKLTGSQATIPSPQHVRATRLKVYLAGGFQSGWQEWIVKALPSFDYFDPRSHGLTTKAEYTAWDLEAIRHSDCVFAYIESTNPGGYALALEVGFAKALGKFVILVDEKSAVDAQIGRYLEMVSETADVSFKSLQEGVAFLEKFNVLA
jgi:nucleoside 2-deoxyribosyltransferase